MIIDIFFDAESAEEAEQIMSETGLSVNKDISGEELDVEIVDWNIKETTPS